MNDIDRSARPKVFPTESSVRPQVTMSYAEAELVQARAELAQVRRELHDTEVQRDEWMYDEAIASTEVKRLQKCLEMAIEALGWYTEGSTDGVPAQGMLAEIEARLAELEPSDEALTEVERERDKLRSELARVNIKLNRVCRDARDWLSPREAEGLRRQLADARRVARLWFRRAHEPMVEVEITGVEMVQALQAERALRREAEQRAEGALATARKRAIQMGEAECRANKNDNYIKWLRQILSEGGYVFSANEDGAPVLVHNPMPKLKREKMAAEQRAEHAEAANDHLRSVASQVPEQVKQRAEALAALVTPRLAEQLERLAYIAEVEKYPVAADHGREFAAKIREVLDDSQT